MARPRLGKRAWRAEWGGIASIVSADSPGQARRKTLASALDAGYRARFPEVKVRRAPEFDGWASQEYGDGCFDPDLLPRDTEAS